MIVFPSWKQDLDSYLNQALTNRLFQLECEENKNNEIIKFTNLQISHSSEVIAYISNENEVKVFSLQEKNLVWSLSPRKKNEKFTCLQFNPKSNNIYVASNVYGIKQYDISTGSIIDEYPVDEGKYCVSFQCSKTGQYLIAALDNGSLVAYHAKKPENLLLLDSGHSHVNSLAITGQEQVILTVSTQELKIWTFPSFKQMFEPTTLEDCTEGVTIKVSDSEKYLLLNCGDHSMNIYNLETLELLYRIEDEERLRIVDFSLTHDDQILIMLASDSSVIFHDFHANQEITRLKTLKYNDPMGLVVSPDLKFFAVASSKGSLIGYELLSSIDVVEEHNVCQNRTVIGICLTHNQKYLIAAEENGTISIYDTNKQRILACYENKVQERIRSLALSADDKYLVIGGENKMFIVFRLDASGQNVQLIKEYESQKLPDVIVKLAVIAANGFVVAELKSGDIQAFQLATKEIIMINNSRLNPSHHNYGRIKAMKQGPGLIFGNDKGHIKIINLLTRKLTHEFRNLVSTPISAIGVSGTLIAVGASDPMIALIRLDHRTVEHILTHQEIATFRSLNFSSDESYLVAATATLVTIYETGRGRQLYSFKVDTEILEAKFFQGTTHIITSHFDGVAKVHKIPFLNEISVIDLSLKVPYGTMSKIPGYKLRRMWNNEIDITPQVIQSFAKSYTLPFKINFWYYYFLTQQSMQEPSVITNWIIDADIPVLTDMDKLNIIYYLVKSNEITSLNTVFRRAEEALDDSPPSVFTSLSDVMDDIIASKVPQLANFLEVCVGQPEVSEQKLLKLGDTDGMPLYVFSNERKLTTKILNTLVKDGADPLVFYTSKVQLDPNFFSPKNLKIFEAVFRNENLEIYRSKLVRKLIDAAWLKARPSLWAKAILDVGFLVLLSIYASSKVDSTPDPWVVNFMYGYNSLLLTYEICQFIGNSKLYIRSVLNLLDLVRIALIYATLINSNASVDDYSNGDASSTNDGATSPKVAGVVIFAIFFNYLKLITHFRLLKPARKLIRMVVETITDMITFTLFFGLITFGLAFMIYLSGILFTNRTAISLGNAIGNVYSIALGQFDVDGYDALDWGLFVLSTFLLAIVLLPLLISIINNTFTEGRKNAIPNEYIEKLDLILESSATQKGLKRLLLLVRKERPPPKVVGSMIGSRDLGSSRDLSSSRDLRSGHPKKYLFWVDEVHAEGENEKEATWETGIRDVRKDVELNVKKHNADIIKKIGLIAKALGTLTETKKEAWKLYCKEQKLSEKAMSDYIIAKRDLHILKRKLDMADEESFEDNDISSELSLEDNGRHFVSEERFISRPKKSGRKTIF